MSGSDIHAEQESEVRIRSVEPCHIADLIYIGESVNLSPWNAESYLAELKNQDSLMLRLFSGDNKTIGFVVGRFVMAEIDRIEAEIYNIAIKENEQCKGYGQILFDAFLTRCLDRGVRTVWLEVRQSNHKAISFYKRNGFESVQKRNHFYDNPREHGWLMRLDLKTIEA
jgi:ribosomal-protein-alanine N-acetyltransferase